jgi:hypothetical protein
MSHVFVTTLEIEYTATPLPPFNFADQNKVVDAAFDYLSFQNASDRNDPSEKTL